MGESQNQPFQLSFNASLRIDFQGSLTGVARWHRPSKTRLAIARRGGQAYAHGQLRIEKGNSGLEGIPYTKRRKSWLETSINGFCPDRSQA